MKFSFNYKFPLLACFILFGMLLSGCDKDDDTSSDTVQLLSFGPTGVKPGEEIVFIGYNLHQVTAIEFVGSTVEKAAFTQQNSETIKLLVPVTTQEGLVKLKTPQGDVVSKTIINFEAPVVITSFTPEARPGENITITGDLLNWVKEIKFPQDKFVTQFVSQSVTELVVKVPDSAKTGYLVFSSGGTEPMIIESTVELKVILPVITGFDPEPAEKGKDLTITGTNLDLAAGILFKGQKVPVTNFKSKTLTQIVVTVPDSVTKGPVATVALSGVQTESSKALTFVGDLPPLDALTYAFYIDNLVGNWQNWGWSTAIDFKSKNNVRDGDASIEVNYTGQWGALKFANSSVSTAAYNELTFSVFGTAGTQGKKINVTPSGGSAFTVVIEEGKWVEYKLTKAQIGNPATITDLTFQNEAWNGIVYVDHVGLR